MSTTAKPKPAMSEAEAAALKRYMCAATHYFEFGAGGSTVLASECPNLKTVRGAESDPAWIRQITPFLDMANSRCRVDHADIGPVKEWGHPVNIGAQAAKIPNYWKALERVVVEEGVKPDLVLIDGRFRVMCCLTTLELVPAATICIHDFTIRPEYHCILPFCEVVETVGTLVVLRRAGRATTEQLQKLARLYVADSA
jgi:hypothetical protein